MSFGVTLQNTTTGYTVGVGVSGFLSLFFGYRFYKSQKFMPNGLLMYVHLYTLPTTTTIIIIICTGLRIASIGVASALTSFLVK